MKPIIMSTEDVRALLDGRKTMARQVIKFPGDYLVHRYDGPEDNGMHLFAWGHVMPTLHVQVMGEKQTDGVTFCDGYYEVKAPHRTGDVLWVRETWGDYGECTGYYVYRADYPHDAKGYWYEKEHLNGCDLPDWHSPVTMPREAARLFLRVTDVRVERVQDITVDDAGREGFEGFHHKNPMLGNLPEIVWNFKNEWDARNAKRGHGWDSNPFVWVIEFERIEKGEES